MPTTLAAISRDPAAQFTIEPVDIDQPQAGEILVRVTASGICHTDLTARRAGSAERPILLGHEGAGIVEAVGDAVEGVRPGDRVVLAFRHCGACRNCRLGRPAYCAASAGLNHFGARPDRTTRVRIGPDAVLDGFFGQSSLAGYALTTPDNTVVVPPETDLAIAAPLGCGFLTGAGAILNVLTPEPESHLVVYGAGAVGMAALLAARTLADVSVIVVETSEQRRTLALKLGASEALDPARIDTVAAIRDLTGSGATHAFDTTGSADVLGGAVAALGIGGTVVAVGLGAGVPPIDLLDIVLTGKTIRGSLEGDATPRHLVPHLLELHSNGRLPLDLLVQRYPYTEINTALADQRAGHVIKPVLIWPAS